MHAFTANSTMFVVDDKYHPRTTLGAGAYGVVMCVSLFSFLALVFILFPIHSLSHLSLFFESVAAVPVYFAFTLLPGLCLIPFLS